MKKLPALALAASLLFLPAAPAAAADAPPPLSEYMNDDNDAQWEKVQEWIEKWTAAGNTTSTPTPSTPPTSTPPGIESGEVKWTTTGVTFEGKIAGTATGDRVQIRTDIKELTGQRGYYEYEFVRADGTVKFTLADYTSPQDKLFWHIAKGGTETEYGDVVAQGTVTKPASTPAPNPTTTNPTPAPSPTVSAPANTKNVIAGKYTSQGLTSNYHLYTEGLDWSKPVGLLIYADGSGGYGFDNPNSTYLMAGSNGIVNVAKKHNMILLMPEAPGPGCDGDDNCWYDSTAETKAGWAGDLTRTITDQYPVSRNRVAVAGYSSGAEFTTRWFGPQQAPSIMDDGVFIPISYGGRSYVTPTWDAEFKRNVPVTWDVGSADRSALRAVRGGEAWYKNQGFTTELNIVQGEDHYRFGQFGAVVDREITQHVPTK